jgi:hypothetical protein
VFGAADAHVRQPRLADMWHPKRGGAVAPSSKEASLALSGAVDLGFGLLFSPTAWCVCNALRNHSADVSVKARGAALAH